jgi:RimJ/RimL family protein N-acetyltransferase
MVEGDFALVNAWCSDPRLQGFRDETERDGMIIECDGQPVGWIDPHPAYAPWWNELLGAGVGASPWTLDLFVVPERWNQGIARTAIRMVTQKCLAEGATCMVVDVERDNLASCRAFEGAGWSLVPTSEDALILRYPAEGTDPAGTRKWHDEFWAAYLGIDASDWREPGVSVRPHMGLRGYRGAWFFRHNSRAVISVPDGWVAFLSSKGFDKIDDERILDVEFLSEVFGRDFDRAIGPTFHGALEPHQFRPAGGGAARLLSEEDAPQVAALRLDCGEEDWGTSGLDERCLYRAGSFADGRLVSLAGYRPWSDEAGDLCVLTHPAHRGGGHGVAATSATVEAALRDNKLLLYQTLDSNVPAVRLAAALGFGRYATNVAVRLHSEVPSSSGLRPTDLADG